MPSKRAPAKLKRTEKPKIGTGKGKRPEPDTLAYEVGGRISEARKRAGFETIARLHRETVECEKRLHPQGKGISQPVLASYEEGRFKPGARELRLLALALRVTPTWLLFGDESITDRAPRPKPRPAEIADVATLVEITPKEKRGVLFAVLFTELEAKHQDALFLLMEAALRQRLGKRYDIFKKMIEGIADIVANPAGPVVPMLTGIEKSLEKSDELRELSDVLREEQIKAGIALGDASEKPPK